MNVDGRRGLELWEAIDGAGDATPYGTEAMHVLRAEKGYPIVGQDTDGTVTPQDLGMDWIVSKTKPDFLGKRSFARADTARTDRKQLVGLLPLDREACSPRARSSSPPRARTAMLGHVTSSYRSAALGRHVRARARCAAAASGSARPSTRTAIAAEVVDSVLYDTEGARRDGRPDVSPRSRRRCRVRGEPPPGFPVEPNTTADVDGRDRALARAGRVARARRDRGRTIADTAAAVDVSANRVAFELPAKARQTCSHRAARSTSTVASRPAAARRRCSHARR